MIVNTIGIDIGTSHTVISERGGGILLCEPTIAVVNPYTSELIAAGSEALSMCGSICDHIRIVTPVKNGVICDFEVMRLMLKNFISRLFKNKVTFFSPKAFVSIPFGMNDMQITETIDTIRGAGLRDIRVMDRPLMSAIGAGIDIDSPLGSLIVEVGAGLTEASAICMGSIVACETISTAGDKIDDTIAAKVLKRCGIKIGKKTAEAAKLRLPYCETLELSGRSTSTGLPAIASIPTKEIIKALDEDIRKIVLCVTHLLSDLPSALAKDILSKGITLTGGSGRLIGLKEEISKAIDADVIIAEKSELCPAIGLGRFIGERLSDGSLSRDNTA